MNSRNTKKNKTTYNDNDYEEIISGSATPKCS